MERRCRFASSSNDAICWAMPIPPASNTPRNATAIRHAVAQVTGNHSSRIVTRQTSLSTGQELPATIHRLSSYT